VTATRSNVIELVEYEPKQLDREDLPLDVGEALWRDYGNRVAVEFPSPKTGGKWQLTAQGWVGYIPLSEDLGLALRPKIGLSNLFRMLEYAYNLRSFEFEEDGRVYKYGYD
jgi:5-methylcytosine-specific restriction enzyme subunit McrC